MLRVPGVALPRGRVAEGVGDRGARVGRGHAPSRLERGDQGAGGRGERLPRRECGGLGCGNVVEVEQGGCAGGVRHARWFLVFRLPEGRRRRARAHPPRPASPGRRRAEPAEPDALAAGVPLTRVGRCARLGGSAAAQGPAGRGEPSGTAAGGGCVACPDRGVRERGVVPGGAAAASERCRRKGLRIRAHGPAPQRSGGVAHGRASRGPGGGASRRVHAGRAMLRCMDLRSTMPGVAPPRSLPAPRVPGNPPTRPRRADRCAERRCPAYPAGEAMACGACGPTVRRCQA